jgi:thymidylate kinase
VIVFEGNDAAGKGGTIRRVTGAFDSRIVRVVPIAAPTDEEKSDHARGLAQPQEVERLLRRGLRHGRAHVDEPRAVDAGRGE